MHPSVSVRNFVGGLLGGTTGILLAQYIHPSALPLGVVFGVVFGWFHSELIALFRSAHQRACAATGGAVQVANEAVAYLGRVSGLPPAFMRFLHFVVERVVVGSVVWIATAPGRMYRWLKADSMNPVCAITKGFAVAWMLSGAPLGYLVGTEFFHTPKHEEGVLGGVLDLVMMIGGCLAHQFQGTDSDQSGRYRRELTVATRHDYIWLLAYLTVMHLRYTIGFGVFVTVAVGWAIPSALAAVCGVYLALFVLCLFNEVHALFKNSGHWLCLGTTLVVTGLSWMYFHDRFEHAAVVWSVALATGVASGAATELIRHPINAFYANTALGKWLAKDALERIIPTDDPKDERGYIGYAFRVCGVFFRHNRMARLFRALCFNTPVARPAPAA